MPSHKDCDVLTKTKAAPHCNVLTKTNAAPDCNVLTKTKAAPHCNVLTKTEHNTSPCRPSMPSHKGWRLSISVH